jgi:hypothetical protein
MLNLDSLYGRDEMDDGYGLSMPVGPLQRAPARADRRMLVAGARPGSKTDVRRRPRARHADGLDHDRVRHALGGPSPYNHGKIPFVPYWGYRDKTTGQPYSVIKRLLDRQDA